MSNKQGKMHMNLVLADTEEFRRVKRRQERSAPGAGGSVVESEEKRTLGLTIVRGAYIVSLSVESPPPADPSARLGKSAPGGIASALSAGPGVAKPAGRGAPAPSLAGPAPGLGGGAPPGLPAFPGAPPGFAGRGGKWSKRRHVGYRMSNNYSGPPQFPGGFPPPGFPGAPPAGFPPHGFQPPPGGGPPGFNPGPRR
ncbi:Small nuclear ribonucleoprotein-associated protein B [Beauveria bassiana]|nr:Small nuclear ribonucleoprotein-associated protein B [Beauveria bassiana]